MGRTLMPPMVQRVRSAVAGMAGLLVVLCVLGVAARVEAHASVPVVVTLLLPNEDENASANDTQARPSIRVRGVSANTTLPSVSGRCELEASSTTTTNVRHTWLRCQANKKDEALRLSWPAHAVPQAGAVVVLSLGDETTTKPWPRDQQAFVVGGTGTEYHATFPAFVLVGAEHLAAGADHVFFLLGLILVSGLSRRLLWVTMSFTVGHSITLALASLGIIHVPQAYAEVCIALSLIWVALAALRLSQPSLLSPTRLPAWLVAGLFGLVHGLGFAGALRDLGVQRDTLVPALLGFNIGLELAQLMLIAMVWAVVWLATHRGHLGRHRPTASLSSRSPWARRVQVASAYVVGIAGVYWAIDRTVLIFVRS